MKQLIFSLLIGSFTPLIFAQTPSASPEGIDALPSPPLFKPMPDGVRWMITRKNSSEGMPQPEAGGGAEQGKDGQGKPNEPGGENAKEKKPTFDVQIVGEKRGDLSHVVTTYSNGNKKDVWIKGSQQQMMCTGWKQPMVAPANQEVEDLDWISASNFKGIFKSSGKKCIVFRDKIFPVIYRQNPSLLKKQSGPDNAKAREEAERMAKAVGGASVEVDPETLKIDVAASIDLESRLPIALVMGKSVSTYKYEVLPPTYVLTLPANVAANMDASVRSRAERNVNAPSLP